MTDLIVQPEQSLTGRVDAPPSKSCTHRAIIIATLTLGQRSRINGSLLANDTKATIEGCGQLGALIEIKGNELLVDAPTALTAPAKPIHCRESGSTLRLLTAIGTLARGTTLLTGDSGLLKRPVKPLIEALRQLGVECSDENGYPPVIIHGGQIRGGVARLSGDVSSQFISGLLLVSPFAEDDVRVEVTSPLESKPYVALTVEMLRNNGINVGVNESYDTFIIPAKQRYQPRNHIVPGDFSSAAFLLAAAAITKSEITVHNLPVNIKTPDCEILNALKDMDIRVESGDNYVKIRGGGLKGIKFDAKDNPDLVPVLAALGTVAEGYTRIFNARRLRLKESNRLLAISQELGKMGGDIREVEDGLEIVGRRTLRGATINPHNDHRIAMACVIAALAAEGSTRITNIECINKSYPSFIEDMKHIGARVQLGG